MKSPSMAQSISYTHLEGHNDRGPAEVCIEANKGKPSLWGNLADMGK